MDSNLARSFGSLVLGLALVATLLLTSDVNLSQAIAISTQASILWFMALAWLVGMNCFLSGLKWRLIERRRGVVIPLTVAFSLTVAGSALGHVLPTPLAIALVRAAGLRHFDIEGATRGKTFFFTLLEQGVDVFVIVALASASAACWVLDRPQYWLQFAVVSFVSWSFVALIALVIMQKSADRLRRCNSARSGVLEFLTSGVLSARLLMELFLISLVRFVLLYSMAVATTHAIGLNVPTAHFAIVLPLVALGSALSLTPAGLGINESIFTGGFLILGWQPEVAVLWSISNRILVFAGTILILIPALALMFSSFRR